MSDEVQTLIETCTCKSPYQHRCMCGETLETHVLFEYKTGFGDSTSTELTCPYKQGAFGERWRFLPVPECER